MQLHLRGAGVLLLAAAVLTASPACGPRTSRPQAPGTFATLAPLVQGSGSDPATPATAGPRSGLTSVSCTGPDACLAVGNAFEGERLVGVAQRWDGRRWSPAPAPPAPAGRHLDLRTIDCPRADHCVAVGASGSDAPPTTAIPGAYLYGERYVARFDGHRWTDESASLPPAPPDEPYLALTDVSCVGTTCIAVGPRPTGVPGDDGYPIPGLAYRSTGPGAGWEAVAGPPVGPTIAYGGLPGRTWLQIECAAATSCVASGLMLGFAQESYTAHWDGTAWTPRRPDPILVQGLSCRPAGPCIAPGHIPETMGSEQRGAVLSWDGTAWTPEDVPQVPGLGLTSCAGPDRCLATGSMLFAAPDLRLAVVHDRTGWHAVPDAEGFPPALTRGYLTDVSCTRTMCLVVGFDGDKPVAYRWAF